MNIKEFIPVQFEAGSVFKVAKNEATLTLTDSKKYADDKTTEINNKYSQLKATTDEINSTVGKQTTTINNLSDSIDEANDKITTITTDVSNIKQTSSEITSTVTQIKNSQIGNNEFIGVSGIGWNGGNYNGAQGWQLDYNDYVYLPPIADVSGDYILSFGNYTQNLQVEIYSTNESYKPYRLNYYCNFNGDTELPIILIEEGDNNDTLKNTYLISCPNENAANLKKDDIVVVKKHITSSNSDVYVKCKIKTIEADTSNTYGTTNNAHKGLYKATFTEFATTDENYKQYASYPKLTLLFTGNTNDRVVDGMANKTLNYVAGSSPNDMWVRFQESIGYNRTFLVRMKSTIQGNCYVGFVQVEDCTKMGDDIRPHKFSMESGVLSSSIKQTATEIRQEVGDSFTSLKNGNFTIGANTKIIGNLNVTGTNNKISITNDDGTQITQIQPVSIGTWDNIKNRSTIELHLYRTQSASFATDNYGRLDSAQSVDGNNYVFTNYFDVGTFNTGDFIQMNTSYGERIFDNGSTSHQNADSKYDLYKVVNGTVTPLMTWNNIASKNYILTETALLRVKVTTTVALGSLNTFKPNSIVTLSWRVGLDAVVPDRGQLITTIGYDGIASSFGNGNYMMIGKDIAAFKYGNYEIQLSKDGIIGLSTKKVFRMFANASGMIYDNTLGAWKFVCGTNTIYNTFIGLNTRTPTYLYLPSSPYDGQEITVIDKCFGVNFYVVPTGGYKMCFDGTTSNSYYKDKHELPQNTMWHFILSYDTWYAE